VTAARLTRAGFTDIHTWLNAEPTTLSSRTHLADYPKTIILGRHMLRLPPGRQRSFAEAVADALLTRTGQATGHAVIDYVRLNIVAHRVG